MAIADGYAFVAGRDRSRVRRLLELADELKIDQREVRTQTGGYVVPVKIADAFEKETAKAEEKPKAEKAETKAPARRGRPPKKTTE